MPTMCFPDLVGIPNLNQISSQSQPGTSEPLEKQDRQVQMKMVFPNRYIILSVQTKAQLISLLQHGYSLVIHRLKKKIENMYLVIIILCLSLISDFMFIQLFIISMQKIFFCFLNLNPISSG